VHAPVPYSHAEGVQNENVKNKKTDAHTDYGSYVRNTYLARRPTVDAKPGPTLQLPFFNRASTSYSVLCNKQ